MPHELNDTSVYRDVKTHAKSCLSFPHSILTGDDMWIYFENPKCKKLLVNPVRLPNRFGHCLPCFAFGGIKEIGMVYEGKYLESIIVLLYI